MTEEKSHFVRDVLFVLDSFQLAECLSSARACQLAFVTNQAPRVRDVAAPSDESEVLTRETLLVAHHERARLTWYHVPMEAGVSLFQRSESVEPDSTAAPDLTGSARVAVLNLNPDAAVNAADTNCSVVNAADTNGSADSILGARLTLLNSLSDDELVQLLLRTTRKRACVDADLLLYLSELDRRKLYRNHACGSLFAYCVTRLGFSEEAAYKRVGVARLLRDYPLVYGLLSEGKVHLSAVILVKPHLTQENQREWLLAVCGKSKREIERLVAARCPKPDVVASVCRLP